MKHCLLLSLFALGFSAPAFSQTNFRFAHTTAQWNVLQTEWCMTSPCVYFSTAVYSIDGDTTIGAFQYQKLKFNNAVHDFIRMDSSLKVFHKSNSGEYMIYNFAAVVDDTFSIQVNDLAGYAFVKVLAVDTVVWDKPRKRMQLCINFWSHDCNIQTFTAIEGIGLINSHFLFPALNFSYTDMPGYSLLCYFENTTTVYHDSTINYCILDSSWVNIKEQKLAELLVSPNPASGSFTISIDETIINSTAIITDIAGRKLEEVLLTTGNSQLSTKNFSSGIYFITVKTDRQTVSKKLVVQR